MWWSSHRGRRRHGLPLLPRDPILPDKGFMAFKNCMEALSDKKTIRIRIGRKGAIGPSNSRAENQ